MNNPYQLTTLYQNSALRIFADGNRTYIETGQGRTWKRKHVKMMDAIQVLNLAKNFDSSVVDAYIARYILK